MHSLLYAMCDAHVLLVLSAVLVQVVLDGRDIVVQGYEKGNFVGPTIISDVKVCAACVPTSSVLLCILSSVYTMSAVHTECLMQENCVNRINNWL